MRMNSRTKIQALLVVLSFAMTASFQNCFQLASQTNQVASQSESIGSLSGVTMTNCQFLGTDSMRSVLGSLGALDMSINTPKGGDLKIVNAALQPQNIGHIGRSSASLGEADPVNGTAEDNTCKTMKFKIATELFIDGCQAGLAANKDRFMASVFPKGFSDRDLQASHIEPIFQKYIGRNPDAQELAELRGLASTVSAVVAPAAVCGAVLSSFEALVR
ncbi:MAG: hypothetical protein K2X47_16700 [Bdellovibrionales bacterium]|nr:hypothetical protein [Bdellovibrionales bacterium]